VLRVGTIRVSMKDTFRDLRFGGVSTICGTSLWSERDSDHSDHLYTTEASHENYSTTLVVIQKVDGCGYEELFRIANWA
jgi:hypothetical protein